VHQPVGRRDVLEGDLDILERLLADSLAAPLPLMLVQETDRIDQREIMLVVAAVPGLVIGKRQPIGVRIDDGDRLEQPVCRR